MAGLHPVQRAVIAEGLKPTAKYVLIVLASFQNVKTGACFPSHEALAERTGLNERSIRRAMDELKSAGIIDWKERERHGRWKGNRHYVLFPNSPPDTKSSEDDAPHRTESPASLDSLSAPHRTESPHNKEGKQRREQRSQHTQGSGGSLSEAKDSPPSPLKPDLVRVSAGTTARERGEYAEPDMEPAEFKYRTGQHRRWMARCPSYARYYEECNRQRKDSYGTANDLNGAWFHRGNVGGEWDGHGLVGASTFHGFERAVAKLVRPNQGKRSDLNFDDRSSKLPSSTVRDYRQTHDPISDERFSQLEDEHREHGRAGRSKDSGTCRTNNRGKLYSAATPRCEPCPGWRHETSSARTRSRRPHRAGSGNRPAAFASSHDPLGLAAGLGVD